MVEHRFGGHWTEIKLDMLHRYLRFYMTALKQKPFGKIYIDAFAGTGFRSVKEAPVGFLESEAATVPAGSARLSLEVDPPIDRYIFIEKNRKRFAELQNLSKLRPGLADRMHFRCGDANHELRALCEEIDWARNRAVVFLDPYGMQTDWGTLQVLAATKAVDLWYLVPTGMGLARLMPRKGLPPAVWQAKIDAMMGDQTWRNFYVPEAQTGLFGDSNSAERKVDLNEISKYVMARLRTIFPGVAQNGAVMSNRRAALYLLTFCCANPRAKALSLKVRVIFSSVVSGRKRWRPARASSGPKRHGIQLRAARSSHPAVQTAMLCAWPLALPGHFKG
jgi:three-Cys-motif partner protein